MGLIEMHVREFREKTAAGDYTGAASNGRVVQVRLMALRTWEFLYLSIYPISIIEIIHNIRKICYTLLNLFNRQFFELWQSLWNGYQQTTL